MAQRNADAEMRFVPRAERVMQCGLQPALRAAYADVVSEPAPIDHIQAILRLRQRERERAKKSGRG